MAYQLTFTDRFKKHYKNLHPNERKQIIKKLELLSQNPKSNDDIYSGVVSVLEYKPIMNLIPLGKYNTNY